MKKFHSLTEGESAPIDFKKQPNMLQYVLLDILSLSLYENRI